MNYISTIERYREYKEAIHELMASILTGVFDYRVMKDDESIAAALHWLQKSYPFVELMFTLDGEGVQSSYDIYNKSLVNPKNRHGKGVDSKHRP